MESCEADLEGRLDCLLVAVCMPRMPLVPLVLLLPCSLEGASALDKLAFSLTLCCKLVLSDKAEDDCMSVRPLLPGCVLSNSRVLWYLDLHNDGVACES